MLISNFLLSEEVQNARFLKFRFLFSKGVQCDLFFSRAVVDTMYLVPGTQYQVLYCFVFFRVGYITHT